MGQIIGKINGTEITSVNIFYEHLYIATADGKHYFMKPADVLVMMTEFKFDAELKKTRTHLHPVTPDVELLYDNET